VTSLQTLEDRFVDEVRVIYSVELAEGGINDISRADGEYGDEGTGRAVRATAGAARKSGSTRRKNQRR